MTISSILNQAESDAVDAWSKQGALVSTLHDQVNIPETLLSRPVQPTKQLISEVLLPDSKNLELKRRIATNNPAMVHQHHRHLVALLEQPHRVIPVVHLRSERHQQEQKDPRLRSVHNNAMTGQQIHPLSNGHVMKAFRDPTLLHPITGSDSIFIVHFEHYALARRAKSNSSCANFTFDGGTQRVLQ